MTPLRLFLVFCFGLMTMQSALGQSRVQLQCLAKVDRTEGGLSFSALIQADQPVDVDYTLTTTMIVSHNIGSSEQTGLLHLQPNQAAQTSLTRTTTSRGGFYELKVLAVERLTGSTCTSQTSESL